MMVLFLLLLLYRDGDSLRDASINIKTHGKGPTRAMMTMIHKSSDLEQTTRLLPEFLSFILQQNSVFACPVLVWLLEVGPINLLAIQLFLSFATLICMHFHKFFLTKIANNLECRRTNFYISSGCLYNKN